MSLSVGGDGACTDSNGDVFITNKNTVVEFAHGGTQPITTLAVPGDLAGGCSVDATTGNLAVVFTGSENADIAIFPNAQGTPVTYASHLAAIDCGYDAAGDLFVDGFKGQAPGLSEMQSGGSAFFELKISPKVGSPGQVQWDGNYMTYQSTSPNDNVISRLGISGHTATVVGLTRLKGIRGRAYSSWIYGSQVFIPYSNHGTRANNIGAWQYTRGGKEASRFQHFAGEGANLYAVTYSPATSNK